MLRQWLILTVLIVLAGAGVSARADIVILVDGNSIEGEILSDDGTKVVVRGKFGKTVLQRSEIREIQKLKTTLETFRERMAALESSERKGEASAWVELSRYAKKENLRKELEQALLKALELEPENAEAHAALGQVKRGGAWVSNAELAPRPEPSVAVQPAEKVKDAVPGDDLAGKTGTHSVSAGSSKRVDCSVCGGTGYSSWIPCNQCKRSPKPGWTGMGERLDPCFTCKTKGNLPGVPCKTCLNTGKVDPEKPHTLSGVEVIKGYHTCGTCNGTGYDFYIPCNQCKRSPAPGWTYMGERMEMCNRCMGEGKLPGTVCKECQGKCIVRDK